MVVVVMAEVAVVQAVATEIGIVATNVSVHVLIELSAVLQHAVGLVHRDAVPALHPEQHVVLLREADVLPE